MSLLSVHNLEKIYPRASEQVHALRGVSFDVEPGEFVALLGPSGCGKSTLLHILGGMDSPTKGKLLFDGEDIAGLDDSELTLYRRRRVGFVFQFFNLLPTLRVSENVTLPLLLDGVATSERRRRAEELLTQVGLPERANHYPSQLSGGEMQRVAIARAIVHKPRLLLADEPTGNLDSENGAQVMQLFTELNRNWQTTIILATHSADTVAYTRRQIRILDGQLA